MKDQTIIDLFNHYLGFWVVELKLQDKYKFVVKKDNRIDAYAEVTDEGKGTFLVKFNTKKFKYKFQIPHTVLHELGHIIDGVGKANTGEAEFNAEYFALSKAKLYYPKMYRHMINWTKKSLAVSDDGAEYTYGYQKALEKLGEL